MVSFLLGYPAFPAENETSPQTTASQATFAHGRATQFHLEGILLKVDHLVGLTAQTRLQMTDGWVIPD